MRVLEILNYFKGDMEIGFPSKHYINESIKEVESLIVENQNLKAENQDLKNSNNELLEGLKSTQKRLEEWLEKCK